MLPDCNQLANDGMSPSSVFPHDAPEPMLYPCRIRHTRLIPTVHSFSYSYLWAMVPIRWKGTTCGQDRVRDIVPGIFSIRAQDYLNPGGIDGLDVKLCKLLDSQELTSDHYPYVLLFTAPRFLGYAFNPVSFWYLYSAQGVLAAAILEVNNTFGERHIYPLTLGEEDPVCSPDMPRSVSELPYRFTCRWPKEFHVSPFNPRDGTYSFATVDPLEQCAITGRIVLITQERTAKLIASIRSAAPPFKASTLSTRQLLALSWIGLATVPRILIQAAQLFFLRKLHVWYVPPPRERTICRRANTLEVWSESVCRGYLDHHVRRCAKAVRLEYLPAGLPDTSTHIFQSSLARREPPEQVTSVRVQILRPDFYTQFARRHIDDGPPVVDFMSTSALVYVSSPEALATIFSGSQPPIIRDLSVLDQIRYGLIRRMRVKPFGVPPNSPSNSLSTVDRYVMAELDSGQRSEYQRHTLQLLLCYSLAFGSWELFRLQLFSAQIIGVWVLVRLLQDVIGRRVSEIYAK